MIKILMIEDDIELAELLTEYLNSQNMEVESFECPELGISALNVNNYDFVILDLSLPGLDGTEVCRLIRKKSEIPIIISSARSDIKDKSICYNYGADDYIPKPYDTQELVLRINALMKRNNQNFFSIKEPKKVFVCDSEKMEICKNDILLDLTNAEYHILEYLIKKSGYPVSREEILLNVDSIKYESNIKSIDVLIGRIRQKIEQNPKKPNYLISIRGVGYKLVNQ